MKVPRSPDSDARAAQEGRRATIQATIASPASRPDPEVMAPAGADKPDAGELVALAGAGAATTSISTSLATASTGCGMTVSESAAAVMITALADADDPRSGRSRGAPWASEVTRPSKMGRAGKRSMTRPRCLIDTRVDHVKPDANRVPDAADRAVLTAVRAPTARLPGTLVAYRKALH